MARQVVYVDDIDGSEDASTVEFTVHGQSYEIDLGPANRELFDKALAQFVDAARKGGAVAPAQQRMSQRTAGVGGKQGQSREQGQAVREWGRKNGFQVSERGRIPNPLQQAFDEAHQGQARAVQQSNAAKVSNQVQAAARTVKPPLPTAEQLAAEHADRQEKARAGRGMTPPAALFSAPEPKAEGGSNSGGNKMETPPQPGKEDSGNDTPNEESITSAALVAWMESRGLKVKGTPHLSRLKMYRDAHPGVKVTFIKNDVAKAS